MMTATHRRSGWGLLALSLSLACQSGPIQPQAPTDDAPPLLAPASQSATHGDASVALAIELPAAIEAKLGQAGRFATQGIDLSKAVSVRVQYSGPGISGWQNLGSSSYNFPAPDADGKRSITVTGSVLAGKVRCFRVSVYNGTSGSGKLIEAIEGVGTIEANQTNTLTISKHTTMTSRIFQELQRISPAQTLTLEPSAIQAISDGLLNVNHVDGSKLRAADPQLDVFRLHPESSLYSRIATMIANGEGAGAPWTSPTPANIPTDVRDQTVAEMQRANVTVSVFTAAGEPVTDSYIISIDDWVSTPQTTPDGEPTTATFTDINLPYNLSYLSPTDWTVTAVNTVSGETLTRTIKPSHGANLSVNLSQAARPAQWLIGSTESWSMTNHLHPAIVTLGDQGAIAARAGVVYFLDRWSNDYRLRKLDTLGNGKVVSNIAGRGPAGTGAFDADDPFKIEFSANHGGLAIDSQNRLYYADTGNKRLIRLTPGGANGYTAELIYTTTGNTTLQPYNPAIYQDPVTGDETLYCGTSDRIFSFDLSQPVPPGGYTATTVLTAGSTSTGVFPYRLGQFLFYSGASSRIYRHDLSDGSTLHIAGGGSSTTSGDVGTSWNFTTINGLYASPAGGLYVGSYSNRFSLLSNATGNDPTEMLLTVLGTNRSAYNGSTNVGLAFSDGRFYYRSNVQNGRQIVVHEP